MNDETVLDERVGSSTSTVKGLKVNKIYPRQVKDTERPNDKQTINYHINYQCSESKTRATGSSPIENKDA